MQRPHEGVGLGPFSLDEYEISDFVQVLNAMQLQTVVLLQRLFHSLVADPLHLEVCYNLFATDHRRTAHHMYQIPHPSKQGQLLGT